MAFVNILTEDQIEIIRQYPMNAPIGDMPDIGNISDRAQEVVGDGYKDFGLISDTWKFLQEKLT